MQIGVLFFGYTISALGRLLEVSPAFLASAVVADKGYAVRHGRDCHGCPGVEHGGATRSPVQGQDQQGRRMDEL